MYINLNPNDDIYVSVNIIAILAPWCGYCRELKDSGLLNKISKKIDVIEIGDDHKDANKIMEITKNKTYPTIILCKNGKLRAFKGKRSLSNLEKFIGLDV
jgi:glutaredoxin